MSKIDWSKAPEWADGHGLIAHHGIIRVWINMDQYAVVGAEDRVYPYGGGTSETRQNFTRGQVQYITPRPARWDGDGLPQVGGKCELRIGTQNSWRETTIKFIGDEILVAQVGDRELCWRLEYCTFRPIPTPEQIAAAEREQAVAEMWSTYWQPSVSTAMEGLGLLYDAGYRKQVTP